MDYTLKISSINFYFNPYFFKDFKDTIIKEIKLAYSPNLLNFLFIRHNQKTFLNLLFDRELFLSLYLNRFFEDNKRILFFLKFDTLNNNLQNLENLKVLNSLEKFFLQ